MNQLWQGEYVEAHEDVDQVKDRQGHHQMVEGMS